GTDEDTIIDVICTHCNYERQEIKKMYKTMYGQDLVDDLKGDLSGTKEHILVEILCTRSNYQIEMIREEHRKFFRKDIDDDIRGDTSGDFQLLLIGLLQGNRSEEGEINKELVQKDAKDIYEAGTKRFGTDEATFNKILILRSRTHLHAVFEAYAKLDKKGIIGAITSETSGSYRSALLAIVNCINDPLDYFATSFHDCIKGIGTKDKVLMQLVVSHSELDLKDIGEKYLKKYGKGLSTVISNDTSGDYRKLLVRLTNIPA
ncbi:hypothetical protein FSP39_014475, partial [Pinctada imbricata]